jgi:hypothetical protein
MSVLSVDAQFFLWSSILFETTQRRPARNQVRYGARWHRSFSIPDHAAYSLARRLLAMLHAVRRGILGYSPE